MRVYSLLFRCWLWHAEGRRFRPRRAVPRDLKRLCTNRKVRLSLARRQTRYIIYKYNSSFSTHTYMRPVFLLHGTDFRCSSNRQEFMLYSGLQTFEVCTWLCESEAILSQPDQDASGESMRFVITLRRTYMRIESRRVCT